MKALRLITAVILSILTVITVCRGIVVKEKENLTGTENYKGVISLWHIDTFEGGTGSKRQFLLSVSREFEKQNLGVLVMVTAHTITSAEENFNGGIFPDLISYGNGIDLANAKSLDGDGFRATSKFKGGAIGNTLFAAPWCRGGYALIANLKTLKQTEDEIFANKKINELVVSCSEYTLPLAAFSLSGYCTENLTELPPKEAYLNFYNGKTPYLLGTQRDVIRINSAGLNAAVLPLDGFNDLYQYVSVISTDENKRFYAEKFVAFLFNPNVQKSLNKISMLSAYETVSFDGELSKLQQTQAPYTVSPFTNKETFTQLKTLSQNAAKGDADSILKIKNMFVLP